MTPNHPEQICDRYVLLSQIGYGANGVVHLARDEDLDLQVALKLSPLRDKDRSDLSREGRLLAKVSDSRVLKVYDTGHWRGHSFLATEYIEGRTLAEILSGLSEKPVEHRTAEDLGLREGSYSEACFRIAIEILEGLDAIHSAGIVHRDLKPANLLMAIEGNLVIIDFGAAIEETSLQRTANDEWNAQIGTPRYMSPEQIEGSPVDFRSDLFSVAVLLHELLTGHPPFEATSWNGVATEIASAEFRPSKETRRRIGAVAVQVLRKALRPKPAHRYQSASEFAEDLQRLRSGAPPTNCSDNLVQVVLRKIQEQPAGIWASAALGILAGVFFSLVNSETTLLVTKDIIYLDETAKPVQRTGPPATWPGLVFFATLGTALILAMKSFVQHRRARVPGALLVLFGLGLVVWYTNVEMPGLFDGWKSREKKSVDSPETFHAGSINYSFSGKLGAKPQKLTWRDQFDSGQLESARSSIDWRTLQRGAFWEGVARHFLARNAPIHDVERFASAWQRVMKEQWKTSRDARERSLTEKRPIHRRSRHYGDRSGIPIETAWDLPTQIELPWTEWPRVKEEIEELVERGAPRPSNGVWALLARELLRGGFPSLAKECAERGWSALNEETQWMLTESALPLVLLSRTLAQIALLEFESGGLEEALEWAEISFKAATHREDQFESGLVLFEVYAKLGLEPERKALARVLSPRAAREIMELEEIKDLLEAD